MRNWLPLDVVPLVEDADVPLVEDADVPELADVVSLLAEVPNKVCRSFATAVAADCEPVVFPDCTDCRRVERSLMKLFAAVLCEDWSCCKLVRAD